MFFGLVAVISIARPRLGLLAFSWIAFVETSRAYVGGHYPSDLIGGTALGFGLVWAAQATPAVAISRRLVGRERSSPSLFYLCASFLSYQIATLFQDVRNVTGGFALVHHLRHLFF